MFINIFKIDIFRAFACCLAFAAIYFAPLSVNDSNLLAQDALSAGDEITDDILLEEFMYGEEWVTIAGKRKQKRETAASAVYVITAEDIKQSGANRLADIFRTAPGMDVVAVDGNSSLVSIRGFAVDPLGVNGISNLAEFSKRLLVLVDGRAIYNPAFGGVFWDQEPIFLEDIERVEIIRGPGATLYGANAVNGVISIITKDPAKEKGGSAKLTLGTQETFIGNAAYAGVIKNFHYRVTGGYREDDGYDDGFQIEDIDNFKDFKREPRVNFRGKYLLPDDADVEVFAGFMDGAQGEQFGGQVFVNNSDIDTTRDMTRAFLQLRYNKTFSETSALHFQAFSNYTDIDEMDTAVRDENGAPSIALDPFEMDVRQYDFELQHSFMLGAGNLITWGANYRNNQLWSRITGNSANFEEEIAEGGSGQSFKQEHNDIFGLFLQDEFEIFNNLRLTVGSKMEHNSFTGSDFSPRASLVFSPWKRHSFRASYSRAYRTPTFLEDSGFFNGGFFVDENGVKGGALQLGEVGSDELRPERLDSYEIGYQGLFFEKLELNIETYFTRYKHIITAGSTLALDNTSRADTSGFEVSVKYPFASWLSLYTNYSFINFNARIADDSSENGGPDDTTPEQKANLGFRVKLKNGFSGNLDLHYVDRIKIFDEFIDDYIRVDLRLAKTIWDGKGEISVTGQNLQESNHAEFIDAEVDRAVYMSLGINF